MGHIVGAEVNRYCVKLVCMVWECVFLTFFGEFSANRSALITMLFDHPNMHWSQVLAQAAGWPLMSFAVDLVIFTLAQRTGTRCVIRK